jgi:hypothetical protein
MEIINSRGNYSSFCVTENKIERQWRVWRCLPNFLVYLHSRNIIYDKSQSHLTNWVLAVTEPMLFILVLLRITLNFAGKEGLSEAHILRMFQEESLKTLIWSKIVNSKRSLHVGHFHMRTAIRMNLRGIQCRDEGFVRVSDSLVNTAVSNMCFLKETFDVFLTVHHSINLF